MRRWFAAALPSETLRGWILRGYLRSPVQFNFALFRSLVATYALTGKLFPICVRVQVRQIFSVSVGKGAKVRIDGVLTVAGWGGNRLPSSLSLGSRANLAIHGDFEVGPNVHISASEDAELILGGKSDSTGSGITCDSRVMVAKRILIGTDTIIAWGVLITDSDWHQIDGECGQEEVSIGDHVWISHGASVLKGSVIPRGSIVAAKSLVQGKFDSPNLLLAGIPAKVLREGIQWKR